MQTIKAEFSAQMEIKKSNFIAYLVPFAEFDGAREKLKELHPKARHIVWAYRKLNEFNQIVENLSDDGEPKSTSGLPCLNALRGAKLINVCVLVVRYFGGIKLGTGGLVRAYGGVANEVINSSELIKFEIKKECEFFAPFSQITKFEHFMKKNEFLYDISFNEAGGIFQTMFSKEESEKFSNFASGFLEPFKLIKFPEF